MTTAETAAGARRHSTGLVIAAGLAGLLIGAIAAFVVTGLVFTVRVQLPPPPYPPPLSSVSTQGGGCLFTPPPGTPTSAPGGFVPAPPLPHPPQQVSPGT
ncbi:hypothetical protein [Mycobacterium shigaense]|uniref:hypothetical protein n=1 Tax=Mycobacterium shigaense TaxID=722731 RepID=UPI000E59871E|nr:hypothetical protein [Mycobacterium shigaense]MEA1123014.1 hypothetical protein [Mycobacterium shigaense]